jgi:chitosanase
MRRRTLFYTLGGLLIPGVAATAGLLPADAGLVPAGGGVSAGTPVAAGTGKLTAVNLDDPAKKEIAMEIVSAAENSSLDWRAQFPYIEDIGDGRGYTAGIIGFCSGTGDMLELVQAYTSTEPGNVLAKYLPALEDVNGSDSHDGLDPGFVKDWRKAAKDPVFQAAQEAERDRVYFTPSVAKGEADGVRALGQFIYYDASVMHGYDGMTAIRKRALKKAKTPAQGGAEATWLNAFLDQRVVEMKKEEAHSDTSRVDTAQRVFVAGRNFDLNPPLDFAVYGDDYHID